jgi:parvulin-like peptidyl-prolyl isomerase
LKTAVHIRLVICAALLALATHAEIIDRIAISVGSRVVTQSDLDRAIRVAAFQDGVKADFGAARKKAVAQALTEQKLIQIELESSRYPLPDPAEITPAIEQFKKEHFKNDAAYRAALAEYGITEQDFRDMLLWQRTLLLFVQVRFETGAPITEAEVQEYFDKNVKTKAEAAHPGQPVLLEDFRGQIEQAISGQRADQQVDVWLKEVRRRTHIVVHDEVLR